LYPEPSLNDARSSHPRRYPTIDDALGPAATRFFGDGHRKVDQQFRSLTLETTPEGLCRVRGKADVVYPRDWSAKSGHAELRPHLSSIDAVALAARATEYGLAQGLSLDSEQRRRMWIRSITFRAGAAPLLDLCDFDVSAAVIRSGPDPFSLCGHASTVECRIGPIKVILEVEHEPGQPGRPHAERPADILAGETADGYYGDEFKKTIREIRGIIADPETGVAEALVRLIDPGSDGMGRRPLVRPLVGIGGAYYPCLTPIDGIVVMAQLAQVLVYATDSLRRDQAGTLWLRHFSMALKTPYQSVDNPAIASLSISKSRITALGGQAWRTVDLACAVLGTQGSFSVTHELPSRPA
jgi:hypothetical protein